MPMHVIAASFAEWDRPAYLLGYAPCPATTEPRWTTDPWHARWLDGAEAETEAQLLATLCPDYQFVPVPLVEISAAR